MPLYRYTASNGETRKVSGTLAADSPRQAREQLRELGLLAEHVAEQATDDESARSLFRIRRPNQVSMVIRELSTLTHAGIPLSDALETLIRQHKGVVREWIMQLRDRVEQGTSLADAMA